MVERVAQVGELEFENDALVVEQVALVSGKLSDQRQILLAVRRGGAAELDTTRRVAQVLAVVLAVHDAEHQIETHAHLFSVRLLRREHQLCAQVARLEALHEKREGHAAKEKLAARRLHHEAARDLRRHEEREELRVAPIVQVHEAHQLHQRLGDRHARRRVRIARVALNTSARRASRRRAHRGGRSASAHSIHTGLSKRVRLDVKSRNLLFTTRVSTLALHIIH